MNRKITAGHPILEKGGVFLQKKAWCLFGVLVAIFIAIGARLGILIGEDMSVIANTGQASRRVTLATLRGTIYDTHLTPLVNIKQEYRAVLLPEEALLTLVRPAMDNTAYLSLLEQAENNTPVLARLSRPVALADGMRQVLTPVRYGDTVPACHLIGYLDSSGQAGVTGLEAAYNQVLSAHGGEIYVSFAVNGSGQYFSSGTPTVIKTGGNAAGGIAVTLDADIQRIVEECTADIGKGAVVVTNPHSGAVLAGASFPTFHPEQVEQSIAADDSALLNRLLSLYDCGSVFKIVTAVAALENGVSSQQTYECTGGMTVGNTVFHCHERMGHQLLDMQSAFAYSCNLYFIQLAQQIGGGTILKTAENLGLMEKIALAEGMEAADGLFPTAQELTVPATLANLSFGQGKLLLSPLHINRMTAIVANGGVKNSLYLYKGAVDQDGKLQEQLQREGERVISYDTALELQRMMKAVVEEGTGRAASLENNTSAGKTGTAQTGQYNGNTAVIQSWFTGYFPAEEPRYVITVLAEDADTTGSHATKLFCEISNKLLEWEREQTG